MKTESGSRRTRYTVAAFSVGLAIGWIAAGPSAPPDRAVPPGAATSSQEVAMEIPAEESPKRAPVPDAPSETDSTIARILEQAAAEEMFVVPVAALQKLRPIRRGRISDEMAEALALTEEEVRRVNRIFEETEEKLNQSELERLEIVSASDDEVIFHIPRDVEGGRQLEAEFREKFTEVLGDLDGALFLNVHDYAYWSDTYFHQFGQVDRTVTFAVKPTPSGERRLRFWNETPWAQKRGGHDGAEGMATWPGFETVFPSKFPGRPDSTRRSKFLIPLLPEPMRTHFKELERAAEGYRAAQEN